MKSGNWVSSGDVHCLLRVARVPADGCGVAELAELLNSWAPGFEALLAAMSTPEHRAWTPIVPFGSE